MNTIMMYLAQHALGKYAVLPFAKLHDALDGRRSEIATGLIATVHVLKLTGVIPPDMATEIEKTLGALLPILIADRASKIMSTVDSIVPAQPSDTPAAQ